MLTRDIDTRRLVLDAMTGMVAVKLDDGDTVTIAHVEDMDECPIGLWVEWDVLRDDWEIARWLDRDDFPARLPFHDAMEAAR